MRGWTTMAWWVGASVWTAGCLDGDRRGLGDATSDATSADTSGDVTTSGDADVSCGDCDDGDPCTFDQCGADGQCEHLPMATAEVPIQSCSGNAECDDGDPCTDDLCVASGGCGVGIPQCVHAPAPGCQTKCRYVEDCDDGDPCTVDQCLADGTCQNATQEGCDTRCTSAGSAPIADIVMYGAIQSEVRTIGVVAPWREYQTCNDGPTCDCSGDPALTSGVDALGLRGPTGGDTPGGETWSCETHGCVEPIAVACQPVLAGVSYRIWGRPVVDWLAVQPAKAAIAEPQAVVGVEVAGYCLDTADTALAGTYEGEIELAGGLVVAFDFTITAVDQGLIGEVANARCTTDPCPDWALTRLPGNILLTGGDGQVDVDLEVPSPVGAVGAHARLFPHGNSLEGRWQPQALVHAVAVQVVGGQLALTRRGLGDVMSMTR